MTSAPDTDTDTETVDALLRRFRTGTSSFFATPSGPHLLEACVRYSIPCDDDLPATVRRLARRTRGDPRGDGVALGVLPFDERRDDFVLLLPAGAPRGDVAGDRPLTVVPGPPWVSAERPAPAEFAALVDAAVDEIDGGLLEKVVLARSLEVSSSRPFDVPGIVRRLASADRGGYVFAVDVGAGILVGASPELLVSLRGGRVLAHPLAGSSPRSPDGEEDRRRVRALMASEKDHREHDHVVDSIVSRLRPLCAGVEVTGRAVPVATGSMWHLGSTVSGTLRDRETSSLDLARALHPTPAVCGVPGAAARDRIERWEDPARGYYAGAVGWMDTDGDGEWAVAIRCGLVEDDRIRLFAGAGVVRGSTGRAELAETRAKLRTLLSALGMGPAAV